ncbi:MAG: hypothetical protein H7Y13_11995 [Sphingobacteriaceae bacterium]|nr:hypothetical protein [Sphingobacteriaceae bacterium]
MELSGKYTIITERCAFFKARVDFYANVMGLDHRQVVEHLMQITKYQGEAAITPIIDAVVPEYLHSSKLPELREAVG